MKNILILIVCSLFLFNCSKRYVFGTKCTSPDKASGAYEKSFIWSVDKSMSNESFGKRISRENCPKLRKKS
tara:strand:+ start:1353 stop:1565 length:213 start_codon:yes stop_codon:yes gene_type:complete